LEAPSKLGILSQADDDIQILQLGVLVDSPFLVTSPWFQQGLIWGCFGQTHAWVFRGSVSPYLFHVVEQQEHYTILSFLYEHNNFCNSILLSFGSLLVRFLLLPIKSVKLFWPHYVNTTTATILYCSLLVTSLFVSYSCTYITLYYLEHPIWSKQLVQF
jgi:hypothetical protein